jgi:hypothetical protein
MGNDPDHADDKMPSAGSTKDLSTGRNLHCKKQPQLAKCQNSFKTHSWSDRRITPDNGRSTITNDCFYFFSPSRISIIFRKNSLLFESLDDGHAVGEQMQCRL